MSSFNSPTSARQGHDRVHHQHTNTLQALRHPVDLLAIARLCCQVTIAASTIQRPGRPREQGLADGVVVVALETTVATGPKLVSFVMGRDALLPRWSDHDLCLCFGGEV